MIKLTLFELEKLWRKRSFLLAMVALLLVNVFLLWYTNLPDTMSPELSSYKALTRDLDRLTEEEKQTYIDALYTEVLGLQLVNDIQSFQAADTDMSRALAKQAMADHPGVYEKYCERFSRGDYLRYTDSLVREYELIQEVWAEASKVYGYDTYLEDIQHRKDTLLGISVFSSENNNDFSRRNIEKEARDYEGLAAVSTRFYPSRGLVSAVKSGITDLMVLLSVFLFACGLIFEEKEKKLFYITRAAALGRGKSIMAKLAALGLHCVGVSVLFYGVNLLFFAGTAGVGNLFRSIQSVAVFMESPLQISVCTYVLLTIVTKAAVLFFVGCVLVFTAIVSKQVFMPFLVGIGLLASGLLLYTLVPAYATVNGLKYLNVIGLLKTENLYGSYLNFNLFGYPFSRLTASWIVLGVCLILGISGCAAAFLKCMHPELVRGRFPRLFRFKPHGNLYRHEGYKLFITNRGIVVLLLFSALLGYEHLSKAYTLAPSEQYYQSLMLQLEGGLTPEKEAFITAENEKYEAAFAQLERIDALVASGELDEQTGNSMKTPYYSETVFYPSFCKILERYENIKSLGGSFVYDTGYQILFGRLDNHFTEDLILLTACMLLAFSSAISMEDQRESWNLLAATVRGRQQILRCKLVLCTLASFLVCAVLWVSRFVQISRSLPLRQPWAGLENIAGCENVCPGLPLFLWVVLMLAAQFLSVLLIVLAVLVLSMKLKNHVQALFTGGLILLVPQILSAMGLSFAGWFSLYPLYNMMVGILAGNGAVTAGYFGAAVLAAAVILYLFRKASHPAH